MNSLNHVAIIMDGNGRWGLRKKKSRNFGHKQGLNVIQKIVKHSIKRKIKYLTLFIFSSENWKRPKNEIIFLFKLLEKFLKKKINKIHNDNIKVKFIGSRNNLSNILIKRINKSEKITKDNKKLQINLALNYGSKNEIINAIKILKKKKIKLTTDNIEKNLYTKNIPNPDILIRTGNTNRLSNFMLWQLSYTEIFFLKKLWPDFDTKDFDIILNKYKKINRNFGAIND